MQHESTILALATPVGTGALAILRMSGAGARTIFATCAGGKQLRPREASFSRLYSEEGEVLDEVVATYFAAPASFTGEDVVEISCHGGMLVVRRLMERLLSCGAQMAQPGEFSQRAFENGKLDLTQAEAIMDVIAAGSDLALRAAQNQLGGAISRRVTLMVEELLLHLAHLEAYIDFPEEDISPESMESLAQGVETIIAQLDELLSTADEGRILREGLRTAIIGAPNAGKSSLLNCLVGYQRAIVSEVAGTTRDTIEEQVNLGGLSLRLIDTAGIHESNDRIERAGMQRAFEARAQADLILHVVDGTQPPAPSPVEESTTPLLLIINKCDSPLHPHWQAQQGQDVIHFSCIEGQGRAELEARITQLFVIQGAQAQNYAAINLRHRQSLQAAREHMLSARDSIAMGVSPEFSSLELREALDSLGEVTGRIDTEELLGVIFSQFCLGK